MADFGNGIDDTVDSAYPFTFVALLLVISLTGMAKQPASDINSQMIPLTEAFYCLAPDFFRIRIPCSSAMSIMTFKARFLS